MINDINNKNIKYLTGLIGSPVSHSLSPSIHKKMFAQNNMKEHDYVVIDSSIRGLKDTIDTLDDRFIGFNVTMPDKIKIIDFLDEVSDEVKYIGAVNTVKIIDGKMIGFNTDGKGFFCALKNRNIDVGDKEVLIYGAGGAAKAISFELSNNGAHVNMLHRPSVDEIFKYLMKCDIFINASPVGMDGKSCPIDNLSFVKKDLFVADLIYFPQETPLLKFAKDANLNCMNGYDMLFEQAKLSFEIWHNE